MPFFFFFSVERLTEFIYFHKVAELHSSDICQYLWPAGSEVISMDHTDTHTA